ncbi:2-oxo-4-hydroxy-4-carboxy-5-ureidoimidazoline decarboxylase [Micromonospora sp. KLBMP9576]|uniref:2-oxo-4-hydroxy-4-carboxy-5-ureidoimidazoline decarboxylase n=1 Tax=Micromonospora sp. KLBMP9576 TaxID=3424769 RepID=UPI003D926993
MTAGNVGGVWLDRYALSRVCASPYWVTVMYAGCPYADRSAVLLANDRATAELSRDDLVDALHGHARIGARSHDDPAGRAEQATIADGGPEVLAALRAGVAAYERHFGHLFLICAAGRGATETLHALRRRLTTSAEQEWETTREELCRINALRLDALLRDVAAAGGRGGYA